MEIRLDSNLDQVRSQPLQPKRAAHTSPPSSIARFDHAVHLNEALRRTPEVRPEAVAKAKECLGDVAYPPPETIRRISVLLAMNVQDGGA